MPAPAGNGRFSTSIFGAKAHVVYDPDFGRPVYHAVSAANVNDISAAKEMPIEAGATYVFDLGYYDFGFFAKLDALGCRLVTRFKTNTPLRDAKQMPLAEGFGRSERSHRVFARPSGQQPQESDARRGARNRG